MFAARAGSRAEWRFVPLEEGELSSDRLALVGTARCTEQTLRHLPEDVRNRLYDLWERARDSILAARQEEQDPQKRSLSVPKAQRDAVALLTASTSISDEAQERAIDALQVAWPVNVSREIRRILDREDASANAKAEQIAAYVDREGLRAPVLPVEPPITREDIHLVCYQAVSA